MINLSVKKVIVQRIVGNLLSAIEQAKATHSPWHYDSLHYRTVQELTFLNLNEQKDENLRLCVIREYHNQG